MNVLVLNAGSASVKFEVIETDPDAPLDRFGRKRVSGAVEHIGQDATLSLLDGKSVRERRDVKAGGYEEAASLVLEFLDTGEAGLRLDDVHAVAHRVVHGAERFAGPARIDESVLAAIDELAELAPEHNPHAASIIRATQARVGERVPMVASFDTAFHRTLPEHARLYGLSRELAERHGIRRFGFHGLSHRYLLLRYARLTGKPAEQISIITLHLESGCSATAIRQGQSIDTSMGFTPLEGLVMGTRCGDLDPALTEFLMRRENAGIEEIQRRLNKESGLLGLSGRSNDTRELVPLAASDERVRMALEVFCYRARKYMGAYLAALNGAEAVVFGGGISENTPYVRARICAEMDWCGLVLDPAANEATVDRDGRITTDESRLHAYVLPAEEGLMIAQEAARCLAGEVA